MSTKSSLISTLRRGMIHYIVFFFLFSLTIFLFRALVGTKLNGKAKIQIDLVAIRSIENVKRETMHVQGLSYWAPANIGPYSQSVVVGN